MRFFVPTLGVLLIAAACASDRSGRRRLEDGSYRFECKTTLPRCLAELADVCDRDGYDVLSATEEKRNYGPGVWEESYVSSEARIRCRAPKALFGGDAPPSPSATPKVARAPAASGRCFPGSTQACLGPGACSGAQTCRAEGAAFGACDCGNAGADAGAASSAPIETWSAPPSDAGAP